MSNSEVTTRTIKLFNSSETVEIKFIGVQITSGYGHYNVVGQLDYPHGEKIRVATTDAGLYNAYRLWVNDDYTDEDEELYYDAETMLDTCLGKLEGQYRGVFIPES